MVLGWPFGGWGLGVAGGGAPPPLSLGGGGGAGSGGGGGSNGGGAGVAARTRLRPKSKLKLRIKHQPGSGKAKFESVLVGGSNEDESASDARPGAHDTLLWKAAPARARGGAGADVHASATAALEALRQMTIPARRQHESVDLEAAHECTVLSLALLDATDPPVALRQGLPKAASDVDAMRSLPPPECEWRHAQERAQPLLRRGSATAEQPRYVPRAIPWEALSVGTRLGGGAFGDVYSAALALPRSGRSIKVALKRPILPHCDVQAESFKAEARAHAAACASRHPNIARLIGLTSQPPALVLERVRTTLQRHLASRQGKPLPLRQLLRAATGIASALEHLKGVGIVHRDLSSANVLIDERGDPRLIDFGMSRCEGHHTASVGTAAWTAPEIMRAGAGGEGSKAAVSGKGDIYAFGVLLWELLSCELPWKGLTSVQVIMRVALDGARLPELGEDRLLGEPARHAVHRLARRCLSSDPGQRPSIDEVITELRAVRRLARSSARWAPYAREPSAVV